MRCPAVFFLLFLPVLGIAGLVTTAKADEPSKSSGVCVPSQQVLLHFKLLELDQENVCRLGLDFSQTKVLKGSPGLNGLVDTLRQNGLVRVHAEPTMTTVLGRKVLFRTGGEVQLWSIGPDGKPVQRSEFYGTCVDCVPRLNDTRDLRVDVKFEQSELDRSRTVVVAGKENPAIRKVVVATTMDLKFGETAALLVNSYAVGSGATGSVSMVMLMTAEGILMGEQPQSLDLSFTGPFAPKERINPVRPCILINSSAGWDFSDQSPVDRITNRRGLTRQRRAKVGVEWPGRSG